MLEVQGADMSHLSLLFELMNKGSLLYTRDEPE